MQDRNKEHIASTGKMVGIVAAPALIGAALSRWHGGGFISGSPKILKAFLWSLPFSVVSWLVFFINRRDVTDYLQENVKRLSYHPFSFELLDFYIPIIAGLFVLIWSMVFKNTGHGGGMDLSHNPKEPGAGRDPEKLEYLILWLHDRMPRYWYDALLLMIIGFFSVAGAAFAVWWINPPAGAIIALGGLGKPAGYMIGWKVYPRGEGMGWKELNEATEIGEALTGLFAYLALGLGLVAIL